MRAFKVAGWLALISVVYVTGLIATAGRGVAVNGVAEAFGTVLALFMVASVAAFFGALIGPKARSTPTLTPIMAGAVAAGVVVFLLYVASVGQPARP
jgi:hypothetical protein